MDFDIDDAQRDLARSMGALFGKNGFLAARRALDGDVGAIKDGWAFLTEAGVMGIAVPELYGGDGGSHLDLAVVAEQAGRHLLCPSLATLGRVAAVLPPDLLASFMAGERTWAVLDGGPFAYAAGRVSGRSLPSLDALGADSFLVEVGQGYAIIDQAEVLPFPAIDLSRGLGRVEFENVGATLVTDVDADRVRDIAQVLFAAEALGTVTAALDLAIEHAKGRQAFGRDIGSFQAVKHTLVDIYIETEQLRSVVWWAAWALDHADTSERALAAASARGLAEDLGPGAVESALRIFGAMGVTWEHDVHLLFRRVHTNRSLLGGEEVQWQRAAELALKGERT